MPYGKVKVYSDGSHYIGIPYVPNPHSGKRCKVSEEVISVPVSEEKTLPVSEENQACRQESSKEIQTQTEAHSAPVLQRKTTRKELFEELYQKSADLKRREREKFIIREMAVYFRNTENCTEFVRQNFERKKRNLICLKIRMWRKINLQTFNFFVTFTYSDELHTEESFKKSLKHYLQHSSSRKGWRYIGVWERSPEKKRLHFHGIFYIPENTLSGKIEEVRDYDTRAKKMRIIHQNNYFAKKFGRNDFDPINHYSEIAPAMKYFTKCLEKSGEKLIYSRGLYQYIVTDIMDDDIVCPYGLDDRKILLFDNFKCWDEGEYIGNVSPETIAKLPKSN